MATYGYLRVSTDEQDVNSQRQGVEQLAKAKGLLIDEFVKDEGISGAKDPSKRKLGGLLKKLQNGDTVIASEISRLGRDLFMVMEILHLCMKKEVKVMTVKDGYELGDNIQSKVLAFAFGLAAEIERQLIRQRTTEGIRLRKQMGVLCGRPPQSKNLTKRSQNRAPQIINLFKGGLPKRQIARVVKLDRNTVERILVRYGYSNNKVDAAPRYSVADTISHEKVEELIEQDKTIPEIHKIIGGEYSELYNYISEDTALNILYREHAQKILIKEYNKRWKK